MSRLHEKDEPLPWDTMGLKRLATFIGRDADELMIAVFRRMPNLGIIKCNGCGRWQDFPPPHTFDAMRARAAVDGWRRDGQDDLCPICVGN